MKSEIEEDSLCFVEVQGRLPEMKYLGDWWERERTKSSQEKRRRCQKLG